MRRSSSSVPINIAEGNVKRSKPDKVRFFDIAAASLEELHCEARLSLDLGYMTDVQFAKIDQAIHRTSYLLSRLRSAFAQQSLVS
jgi:four helix bundle protein